MPAGLRDALEGPYWSAEGAILIVLALYALFGLAVALSRAPPR